MWTVNYQDGSRAAVGFIAVCSKPLQADNYDCVET